MTKIAKAKYLLWPRSQLEHFDGRKGNGVFRPEMAGAPGLTQFTFSARTQSSPPLSTAPSTSIPTPVGANSHTESNGYAASRFLRKMVPNGRAPHGDAANLLPALELIRGLACLQVFLSHIFIVLMFHSRVKMNPSFWKLAVLDWGYQSVMVFFVLSGCVIALSHQRKQQDFSSFMRSRFRRLEPLYLVALALSFGLEALYYPPPAYDRLLGHLLYFQGSSFAPVFNTNAPLWSLGCEFFFYLTFAFTIGRNQKFLNIGWFILGLGAIALNLAGFTAHGLLGYFQYILALSPVWLLGTFLIQRPISLGTTIIQKLMLFGMLPLVTNSLPFLGASNGPAHSLLMGLLIVPLLCAATRPEAVQSHSRPRNWVILFGIYFALATSLLANKQSLHNHTEIIFDLISPFLFLFLVPLYHFVFGRAPFFTSRVTRLSLALGKMSYAIYIIHFPILIALGKVMINPWLQILADIVLVIPLAWFLAYHVDPLLASGFDRIWPAGRKSEVEMDRRYPVGARRFSP